MAFNMNRPIVGKEKRTYRSGLLLEPAELEELDNFRYEARIPNRSEAIRYLIKLGLEKFREIAAERKSDAGKENE